MASTIYDVIQAGRESSFPDSNEGRALRLCLLSEVYQRYYFSGIDIRAVVNARGCWSSSSSPTRRRISRRCPYPTVPLPAMPPAPVAPP